MKDEPPLHATATAVLTVGETDLASALPLDDGDAFPAVFATVRMVALMEIAAARLLRPCLEVGELSVGVSVEATHSAPTPLGATITATARYLGHEGKLFSFEVVAADAAARWAAPGTSALSWMPSGCRPRHSAGSPGRRQLESRQTCQAQPSR